MQICPGPHRKASCGGQDPMGKRSWSCGGGGCNSLYARRGPASLARALPTRFGPGITCRGLAAQWTCVCVPPQAGPGIACQGLAHQVWAWHHLPGPCCSVDLCVCAPSGSISTLPGSAPPCHIIAVAWSCRLSANHQGVHKRRCGFARTAHALNQIAPSSAQANEEQTLWAK